MRFAIRGRKPDPPLVLLPITLLLSLSPSVNAADRTWDGDYVTCFSELEAWAAGKAVWDNIFGPAPYPDTEPLRPYPGDYQDVDQGGCWTGNAKPGAGDNAILDSYTSALNRSLLVNQNEQSSNLYVRASGYRIAGDGYGSYTWTLSNDLGIDGGSLTLSDRVTIDATTTHISNGGSLNIILGAGLVSDNVYLGSAGTGTIDQDSNTSYGSLFVASGVGSTGIYNLHSGNLHATALYVGQNGTGTFTQDGGTVSGSPNTNLTIGQAGSGTYNLNAGTLSVQTLTMGTGVLNINGGTMNLGTAVNSGGTGTINIDGGTLNFTGTSLDVDNFNLGYTAGHGGSFTLSSGKTLKAAEETIGYAGTGTLTQAGGTSQVTNLYVGRTAGGSGSYSQQNGTNTVGTLYLGANGGNGSYTLQGGTLDATSIVDGTGTGTFSFQGGTLKYAGKPISVDNLNFSSGATFAVNNSGLDNSSSALTATNLNINGANFSIGNGSVTATNAYLDNAAVTQGGGTVTSTNFWLAPGYYSLDPASYTLNSGSFSTDNLVIGNTFTTGTFNFNGGTLSAPTISLGVSYPSAGVFNQNDPASVLMPDSLYIGKDFQGTGTYNLYDGFLRPNIRIYLGYDGSGTFNQYGGTTSGVILLASGADSTGVYNLYGGLLRTPSFRTSQGLGTLNIDGGTLTLSVTPYSVDATYLNVGNAAGRTGSHTINTGETYSAWNTETIGYSGNGTLTQVGGSNYAPTLYLGRELGSTGTYYLRGGDLTVKQILNGAGDGTLVLNGGNLQFDAFAPSKTINVDMLVLGESAAGLQRPVSFNLQSGVTLNADTVSVGNSGSYVDTMYQVAGSQATIGTLRLGAFGLGQYVLQGGTLNVGSVVRGSSSASSQLFISGGVLNFTGTQVDVDSFYLGYAAGTSGSFDFHAGQSLSARLQYIGRDGTGTLTQSGGTNTVRSGLFIAASPGAAGTYNLTGGSIIGKAPIAVGGNSSTAGGTGTFSISNNGDVSAGTLKVWDAGTLNLSGGHLSATTLDIATPGAQFNFTGGTLAANTINGSVLNQGGTLAPGASPGTTHIVGNYTQASAGALNIELGGLIAGTQYDVLNVDGTATLAGILNVSWYDLGSGLFSASLGDTFTVLSATDINGQFDTLNLAPLSAGLKWDTNYLLNPFSTDFLTLNVIQAGPIWQCASGYILDGSCWEPTGVPGPTDAIYFIGGGAQNQVWDNAVYTASVSRYGTGPMAESLSIENNTALNVQSDGPYTSDAYRTYAITGNVRIRGGSSLTFNPTSAGNPNLIVTVGGSASVTDGSVTTGAINSADGATISVSGAAEIGLGGTVTSGHVYVGTTGTASNSVYAGSLDTTDGGRVNASTVTIENGANVSSIYGVVASSSSYDGQVWATTTATVTGAGSSWDMTYLRQINGTGTLTVADGANLTASDYAVIGAFSGADQTLYIDNATVALNTAGGQTTLGYGTGGVAAKGTVIVTNGGTLQTGLAELGYFQSSAPGTGLVTVGGGSGTSTWNAASIHVGGQTSTTNGTGTLMATSGGVVNIAGDLSVWGENASVSTTGTGIIKSAGDLILQNGGKAYTGWGAVDDAGVVFAGGLMTATAAQVGNTGAGQTGSLWNVGTLIVGRNGTGQLDVLADGTVNAGGGYVGEFAGSTGKITVGGTNSVLQVGGGLYLGGNFAGSGGTGSLVVNNGGSANVGGELRVWNGTSSVDTTGGGIVKSAGQMVLQDGGTAYTGWGAVDSAGVIFAGGLMTVNGAQIGNTGAGASGSLWDVGTLIVGRSATGNLDVMAEGKVNAGSGYVGEFAGSTGQITVGGTNAVLAVGGGLYLGGNYAGSGGTGSLVVNSGGSANAAGEVKVWNGASSVNLAGGTLIAATLSNLGTIQFTQSSLLDGALDNQNEIDVAAGATATFGGTVHNGGTVDLGAASTAIFQDLVSGAGDFTGTGTAIFEGGFSPGNSPGLVSFGGDLVLDNGILTMELGGTARGTGYDALDVAGTAETTLNGLLEVVLYGGFTPLAGDSFDLVRAQSLFGTFGGVTLPNVQNIRWQLQTLFDADGNTEILRLTATAAVPVPPAVWLFGSALGVLGWVRRRQSAKSWG